MATRRLLVFLAGALAIGIGAAWIASDFHPASPGDRVLQVGVAYAVEVEEDQATFDLPFEPGATYRVIVSSTTPQEVESTVTLSAEPIPGMERSPLRPVPELQSAIPKQFQRTWTPDRTLASQPRTAVSRNPEQRTFYLHVTDGPLDDARQYAKVVSHRVAEGNFVRVYLDSQMEARALARGLVPEIIRLFDEEIVPESQRVLGHFRDVDGDGKFAIMISPWLGKLQGGQTALGGFVRGSDFQQSVRTPFGNHADVLYLNSSLQPGPHLKALLAHEYAHAICFSERLPTASHPDGLPTEDDWLNEAIAHVAENVHGTGWTNLDYRISQFLDATDRPPLVVRNYYANGLWRDPGCRGATYLFLRWVTDQFGEDVLARLIRNSDPGIKNLETATGVPFPELFRGWTIALAQADRQASDEGNTPKGQFHSIGLTDRMGRWNLQGPRPLDWDLNQEGPSFSLLATTAKILDVRADVPGIYRLRIRTTGQPHLQVTVIRQPEGQTPSIANADWQFPVSLTSADSPMLHVRLPGDQKIVRLSVECQSDSSQSHCWEAEQLSAVEVPSDADTPMREFVLTLPERLFPGQQEPKTHWQLKILTEDQSRHRSAQWVDLPSPKAAQPHDAKRLAGRPDPSVL